MRIAVVGSGIAGNAAAWTLSRRYKVTVYERELRPGGHSHTVMVVVANARRGEMMVEGLEAAAGSVIPRVVARRSIAAAPPARSRRNS